MVFRKIDYRDLLFQMRHTALWWVLPALFLFVLSKWISSIRLNLFFNSIGLHLGEKENLRLYWLGMFYNMFLPGGIGGDGYKIYLLNRKFQSPAKRLFWAVFLDRVSGLGALLFLCALLVVFIFPNTRIILSIMGILTLACLAYYFIYKKYFPSFMGCFWRTNFQGLLVQIAQVICACCIMKALHIETHYPEYILLFLISSVVAIFPFTMGGLGARELSFVYGSEYLMLNQQSSVIISFWFYLITLVVSLAGIIYVFRSPFENGKATSK